MAKSTLWLDHIEKFVPDELIYERNETELRLTLANGHTITLYGADNPDRLRGMNIDFVILDEFQDFRPSSWELVIEPNILATKGRALFMGTPKGKRNILYEQYLLGFTDPTYESFNFTSYDNPLIDRRRLESVKARLLNSGKKLIWDQEYMAKFTTIAGLIYPEFKREVHVQDIEMTEGSYAISIDRGIENPSAVGFYFMYRKNGEDRMHLYDEIYKVGLSPRELVEEIKLKMGDKYFNRMYCDPAAKDFIATANEMGLYVEPASKQGAGTHGWVLHGISECHDWLAKSPIDGEPRFTVSPRCRDFIDEIEKYVWEEQPDDDLQARERPKKINDHSVDQWRYMVVSYRRIREDVSFPDDGLFREGFY